MNLQIALTGYSAAAVAFGILVILLLSQWRGRVRGSLLAIACLVTAAWAALLAWASLQPVVPLTQVFLVEIVHDLVWLVFLSSLLGGAVAVRSNWLVRRGGVALGLVLLVLGLVLEFTSLQFRFPDAAGKLLILGSIATSLYALVGIEQLYRNARPSQQNGLKFLCLGLAGMFAYDLFLYSNAIVDGYIPATLWAARGYVVALCMPLLAIGIRRIATWSRGIFASRQIVFYTTTLFAAGIYLTLVGFAGYYIQTLGKTWGDVLMLVFFSASILGFFVLAMSEQLRARIRVWLIKHFFERKYDYRVEWLRLTHTLVTSEVGMPLKKRAVQSIAQILDSPAGCLWQTDEENRSLVVTASWNMPLEAGDVNRASPLMNFLADKGWVIDIAELATSPDRYAPLKVSDLPGLVDTAGYIVPLQHEEELVGFIALAKPRTPVTLDFEDHDLLKTAGQQVASYLAQEQATERLAENRQFEAYNRFAAFVMHDLKNAIAQQSLVVENAAKHKRNPEFIDDAIETIKGSVERMQRVLGHLKQGVVAQRSENVDLTRVLLQVESQCADREPVAVATVPERPVVVQANRERVTTALIHAVRNAQDACAGGGTVSLTLDASGEGCRVCIVDTGCGMEEDFIRERLFRPFDSTKGTSGMGIGAYQIREMARAGGGDVDVKSEPGVGTTLILRLPLIAGGAE